MVDYIVHTIVLVLLVLFFGYFSLRADSDPNNCFASDDEDRNEVLYSEAVSILGEPTDGFRNVGAEFRAVFDILFFDTALLLILQTVRSLTFGEVK